MLTLIPVNACFAQDDHASEVCSTVRGPSLDSVWCVRFWERVLKHSKCFEELYSGVEVEVGRVSDETQAGSSTRVGRHERTWASVELSFIKLSIPKEWKQ